MNGVGPRQGTRVPLEIVFMVIQPQSLYLSCKVRCYVDICMVTKTRYLSQHLQFVMKMFDLINLDPSNQNLGATEKWLRLHFPSRDR